MQRKIETVIQLGKTVSPFDSVDASLAVDRTASNYTDAGDKVRKIQKLIKIGAYDADIVQYIPRTLHLDFQGMLESIDSQEQPAHSSYRDIENLDFQLLLTNNYYTNYNSIHLCFPMKILKTTNRDADIDDDLITVNNFFAHLIKKLKVTKYGNDKQLIPTFSPYEI